MVIIEGLHLTNVQPETYELIYLPIPLVGAEGASARAVLRGIPVAGENHYRLEGLMKRTIVALVPMRHHSERVRGKNYRSFGDRPLYHHIIISLQACPQISEVVVDTDSQVIMEDASKHFPQVRLIERPEYLRAGTVPMNDVLLYDVTQINADYYLQTHSTNPLLSTETISQGIRLFLDKYPIYDSLFSVTRVQIRLWDGLTRAINHNPAILLRTQNLPPVYEENSCLYIFTRSTLETRHNRIGERPLMFEIDRIEAWDIDDELGFRLAEFLYRERQELSHGVGA